MTWLASCGQVDYRTHLEIYCPKIKNYTNDFEQELASEIESLDSSYTAIPRVVSNYGSLRDRIRACERQASKEVN